MDSVDLDLPPLQVPRFTGPEEEWPSHVKGATNLRIISEDWARESLTQELRLRILDAALQDNRVNDALGSRFAYITSYEAELGNSRKGDGPNDVLLIFFSHSKNATVEVRMEDLKVKAINTPKYIPPAGQDEIKRAIDLARKDSKLERKVQDLNGTAIVDSSIVDSHKPDFGHRVLVVTFSSKGNRQIPIYFAIVDLTDDKVLDVGSRILGRR